MDLLIFMLIAVAIFMCGWLVGTLGKGIRIIHEQPQQEFEGYNEPVLDNMHPDVREYLDKHYGNVNV